VFLKEMATMNRRHAISLLAALPFAARLDAQTRPTAKTRVVLGREHGLMFEVGGAMQSWRTVSNAYDNAGDELGLGDNRPLPKHTLGTVKGLTNVVAAAAGLQCSFAVLGDGRLLSWGGNSSGRLGTMTRAAFEAKASWGPNSNTPAPVVTKFDAVDVASQNWHVLALARDGSVYAWGDAEHGKLGIGPLPVFDFRGRSDNEATGYLPYPMRIPDLSDVVAIDAGFDHSLALLKDGTVRAWGHNRYGQLGDGTTMDRDRPVVVQGIRNAIAIGASSMASAAALADGTVVMWGTLTRYAQGLPIEKKALVPSVVAGVGGVRKIAGGLAFFMGLTDAGTVMTWGDNTYSEQGRGGNPKPAGLVTGLTGVQSIAARSARAVAVLATGQIMNWGYVVRPGGKEGTSAAPIPLWLDGLQQP
jgi:alpha-tubulin suppressor-like RCC1 family protein